MRSSSAFGLGVATRSPPWRWLEAGRPVLAPSHEGNGLSLARPALVAIKKRSMELQAGQPARKGNQRGPAYAYNVKETQESGDAVATQAERAYEHFVGQWRPRGPGKGSARAPQSGQARIIRRPDEACSRRPALRHEVARAEARRLPIRRRPPGAIDRYPARRTMTPNPSSGPQTPTRSSPPLPAGANR